MIFQRTLILLATAGAALAVAGCSLGDDGARTTQTRELAHFTRIENPTSVDVRLQVGAPQRVQVRAGEKIIDDVRTEVRDGTLHLTFDHHSSGPFSSGSAVVEVSVPRLTGIEVDGSGDVDADGIQADAFEIRSDGSGDVALEGTVGRLAVDLDGSGNADLADLTARHARVTVSGSGGVDVRAVARLDVDIEGSGDVRYHGQPVLTQRVDGSGDLRRAS